VKNLGVPTKPKDEAEKKIGPFVVSVYLGIGFRKKKKTGRVERRFNEQRTR